MSANCRLINLNLSQVAGAATGSYWLHNFDGNYTFTNPNYTSYGYGMANWLLNNATFSTSVTNGGFTLSNATPAGNLSTLPLDPCATGTIELIPGSYSILFSSFVGSVATYSTYFYPLYTAALTLPATFSATTSTVYNYGIAGQTVSVGFISTATWIGSQRQCSLLVDSVTVSTVGITGGQSSVMNVPQIYSPSFVQFVISGTSYAPNQLLLSTGASGYIACQNFSSQINQATYYVSYQYTTLYQAAVAGSPIYTDFGLTMPAPNGTYSDGSEVAFLFSGNGVATGYATCASQVTTSTTTTTTTHAITAISVHLGPSSATFPAYCSSGYTTATVYVYAASLGPGMTLYSDNTGTTKYDPSGTYGYVWPASGGTIYVLLNSVTQNPQGQSC